MLFCIPGVALFKLTVLFQFFESLPLSRGFILSREMFLVFTKFLLCHLSEYQIESIVFPLASLRRISSPVFTKPRLDSPKTVLYGYNSKLYLATVSESAINRKYWFGGSIMLVVNSFVIF